MTRSGQAAADALAPGVYIKPRVWYDGTTNHNDAREHDMNAIDTTTVHTDVSAVELAELIIAEPGQYKATRNDGALWVTYPAAASVADDGTVRLSNAAHSQEYAPSTVFATVRRMS
jgi:hypothetical protein